MNHTRTVTFRKKMLQNFTLKETFTFLVNEIYKVEFLFPAKKSSFIINKQKIEIHKLYA